MTTSIATCLMRMNGPAALRIRCLGITHAWSVEHSLNQFGQLVYSSIDSTSILSVVAQPTRVSLTWNWRNTLGDRPQYSSSSSLVPPAPLFHRLSQRTTRYAVGPLPTLVPLNPVVVLPTRLPPNRSAPVVICLSCHEPSRSEHVQTNS